MPKRVTVRAPATSANMGPGFDCLALALDLWSVVTVEVGGDGFEIDGEGAESLPRDSSNLVARSFRVPFEQAGREAPAARFVCDNGIPLARGLGSSSAAVAAGLLAGNEVCGRRLAQDGLLSLAAEIEGHPDNVSAALLGGCQIVVESNGGLVTSRVPVPADLKAVVYIPEASMPTQRARGLLQPTVARSDAVFNIGRAALLVNALAAGDLRSVAVATQDRLHQPARAAIFPPMKVIVRAALDAGSAGAFLSGAGSSVLALTTEREVTIGYEMAEAASKAGVEGTFMVVALSERGAYVDETDVG